MYETIGRNMLAIFGNESRLCDGISRRNFLKVGALGLGGVALPQLLQAEARSGIRKSHKAVIMSYLPGGPAHQDMHDLKMDAPMETRFASICQGKRVQARLEILGVDECLPS